MVHIAFDTETRRGVFLCDAEKKGQTYYHVDSVRNNPEFLEEVSCWECKTLWREEGFTSKVVYLDNITITEVEMSIGLNEVAAKVYEKTEDALLVTQYARNFGLTNDAEERNLIWLRANKAEVLKRAGALEKEKLARVRVTNE